MDPDYVIDPKYFMAVVKASENRWTAYGSRKLRYISFEGQYGNDPYYDDGYSFGDTYKMVSPIRTIKAEADLYGMISVTANSPLAAIGALIDAFREEEEREAEESRQMKRKAELARFGGEIDEELVRKIVKWRKKRSDTQH